MGAAGFLQAAGGAVNAWAAVNRTLAARDQADFEAETARKNIFIAEGAEANAHERGQQQQMASRLKYGALRGEQAAAYGASGVNVNSGSALATLTNTQAMSDYDAQVIANNAAREAWGYRQKEEQFAQEANMAQRRKFYATLGGGLGVAGSLLGSAGGAVGNLGGGGGE